MSRHQVDFHSKKVKHTDVKKRHVLAPALAACYQSHDCNVQQGMLDAKWELNQSSVFNLCTNAAARNRIRRLRNHLRCVPKLPSASAADVTLPGTNLDSLKLKIEKKFRILNKQNSKLNTTNAVFGYAQDEKLTPMSHWKASMLKLHNLKPDDLKQYELLYSSTADHFSAMLCPKSGAAVMNLPQLVTKVAGIVDCKIDLISTNEQAVAALGEVERYVRKAGVEAAVGILNKENESESNIVANWILRGGKEPAKYLVSKLDSTLPPIPGWDELKQMTPQDLEFNGRWAAGILYRSAIEGGKTPAEFEEKLKLADIPANGLPRQAKEIADVSTSDYTPSAPPFEEPREEKKDETKPIETKPIETKPIETKPADTKPSESWTLTQNAKKVLKKVADGARSGGTGILNLYRTPKVTWPHLGRTAISPITAAYNHLVVPTAKKAWEKKLPLSALLTVGAAGYFAPEMSKKALDSFDNATWNVGSSVGKSIGGLARPVYEALVGPSVEKVVGAAAEDAVSGTFDNSTPTVDNVTPTVDPQPTVDNVTPTVDPQPTVDNVTQTVGNVTPAVDLKTIINNLKPTVDNVTPAKTIVDNVAPTRENGF